MAEIKKTVQVSGNSVNYFVRYGKQKNIILRVKEGEIHISAPEYAADWEIELLIQKNYPKINKVQQSYDFKSMYDFFGSKPWVKIFDEKVDIVITDENIHTRMEDNKIYMKDYHDYELQLEKLYPFLAKEYKNWFHNRARHWAFLMNVEYKNLSVRILGGKWGVCYPQQSKIIFNTKLLHFKPEIIDYVIVHELTHLVHPNHSPRFYAMVEEYLPNYRDIKGFIDESGL